MMIGTWKNAWDGLTGVHARNARDLAALGPAVNDWVAAAPVLAVFPILPPVRDALKRMAAGGFRLKTVMAALGIPPCLRKLSAADVEMLRLERIAVLIRCDAAMISAYAGRALKLADAVDAAVRYFDGATEAVGWFLSHDEPSQSDLSQIKDYFDHCGQRWDWSPRRILKEHGDWARSLSTEKAREIAMRPENQVRVNIGDNPEKIEIDGVLCTAIVTPGNLILEGAAMAHCVGGAGFQQCQKQGTAMFYHLSSPDGESTVELVRAGTAAGVRQHFSEHNSAPPETHQRAVRVLAQQVRVLRDETPDWRQIGGQIGELQGIYENARLAAQHQAILEAHRQEQMRALQDRYIATLPLRGILGGGQ